MINQRKRTILVEINLTQILMREMKENNQIKRLLMLSALIDIIVRINSLLFISLALSKDNHQGLKITASFLIAVPRLFFILAQSKLLFINIQKLVYNSIVPIAILY